MNAKNFNKQYPVGTRFMHTAHQAVRGGLAVKTVAPARDFKCGCVVEINVEPYFVKVETLKAAH
ncbi:TPA: hypothetical protein ACP2HE_000859 [Escherichia coli]